MKQFFLALFTLLIPTLHAQSDQNGSLISQIIAHEEYCVQSYGEGKIYLNPDNICSYNGQIFIALSKEHGIVVPFLNYDSEGEYILAHSLYERPCPGCGRLRRGPCTTKDCPYNPETREDGDDQKNS